GLCLVVGGGRRNRSSPIHASPNDAKLDSLHTVWLFGNRLRNRRLQLTLTELVACHSVSAGWGCWGRPGALWASPPAPPPGEARRGSGTLWVPPPSLPSKISVVEH